MQTTPSVGRDSLPQEEHVFLAEGFDENFRYPVLLPQIAVHLQRQNDGQAGDLKGVLLACLDHLFHPAEETYSPPLVEDRPHRTQDLLYRGTHI